MKKRIWLLAAACVLLSGCASLLDREYSRVEAHSSKFWESEATGILRAENYQDIVNDLMLLVGRHADQAVIRLYSYDDGVTVADRLEQAAAEVQQETALGSYALEYITSSSTAQRGYYELSVQLGYRRTAEQIAAIVNATSAAAVPSLLESALDEEKPELTVRVGYWREGDRAAVVQAAEELRLARDLTDAPPWLISYYPEQGPVGLIEFDLAPSEDALTAFAAETGAAENNENAAGPDGAQDGEAAVSPQAGELPPAGSSASAPAGYGGAVDAVGMAEFSARQTDGGTAPAEPPA